MIQFQVLGGADFRGVETSDAEALGSHPYWIATLAALLLPATGVAWRRDALAALLWSSVDRKRGRASLRVVLHGLRRHLGSDVIVASGDELRIDRERLTSDVFAFQELLTKRRVEEALEVYAGDLLPGLFVGGAPLFTAWLSDRRDALRRSAADAAWTASGIAERRGQRIAAVGHARRAVSLSMDSEPAVRRLLILLDRTGDGTTAVREYLVYADRWQRELGVEPSEETRELVEEIRGRRAGGATPARSVEEAVDGADAADAAQATPKEIDRWADFGRLVVLPFAIESDGEEDGTALEHLAAGLAHDVIASLARVMEIVVVARAPSKGPRRASSRIPSEIGRELGADLVLDTTLRIVADRLVVICRLVDVGLQRPIWAEAYDGSRTDLMAIRRQLLYDVLAAAGIELTATEGEHLARGQTSSAAAFELYLEARSRWNLRTSEELETSIRLFEEALAIDRGFALAQAGLMEAHTAFHPAAGRRLSETAAVGRDAARKALELDPGLGEVHATLGLLRAFVDQDWDGAEADMRHAIELSPGNASAHHWLGALLTFVRRRSDEGTRELELARQLEPYSPVIRTEIGLAQVNRGDLDGARRTLAAVCDSEPTFWRAGYYLAIACFLAGDPETGTEHLRRAWELGAFGARPEERSTEERSTEGDAGRDWRGFLERRLERLASSGMQPGIRAVESALLAMFLGRGAEALKWLQTISEHSSTAWITMYFPVFQPLLEEAPFRELLADAGLSALAEPS